MPDENTDSEDVRGLDDLLGEFVTGGDPLAGTPEEAVEQVLAEDERRSLLEAAVTAPGFEAIHEHCGEEYDATFDSNRSAVLALTDDRPLTHLVSFQPRVPNSPFDDELVEVGLIVLFEDGRPAQAVAFRELYIDGTLDHSTVVTYEDEEVVEHIFGPEE